MATHSSILALRIPWTEEPGGLQSMGSQRVGHDWATDTFTFHKRINLEKWELGSRKWKLKQFTNGDNLSKYIGLSDKNSKLEIV